MLRASSTQPARNQLDELGAQRERRPWGVLAAARDVNTSHFSFDMGCAVAVDGDRPQFRRYPEGFPSLECLALAAAITPACLDWDGRTAELAQCVLTAHDCPFYVLRRS